MPVLLKSTKLLSTEEDDLMLVSEPKKWGFEPPLANLATVSLPRRPRGVEFVATKCFEYALAVRADVHGKTTCNV